ncbi:MAG: peptidoglycan DD-metalloendopeptidase family protein [Pedobacter sp.]|jgi:septal ring factor EnvC (AmiA/AmiB activator)
MNALKSIFFLFVFCFAAESFAQSSSELKRQKEALTREIESLNRSLNQTANNKNLSLKEIRALNAQIRLRERKISVINSEVKLLDNQISENSGTVRSLQGQLIKLKKEYAAMVLFAFRNQSAYSKLMFIFASQDFNQAYKRLKYLQQFSEYRKKQARYIEGTQNDLNHKITELDKNKKEKNNLLTDQQKERKTLAIQKNSKSKVLSSLTSREKKLKQELTQKQRESARLNRAIQNAINREIDEARKRAEAEAKAGNKDGSPPRNIASGSSILAATPESAKLSSDFLGSRGNLPWPVTSGMIIEDFGNHTIGRNVTVENNGVDIKTAPGSAVRAVFSGEVAAVQNISGSYAVLIRHGEYFTVYSNLKSVSVSRGQKVSLKQNIGVVITDPVDGTTEIHFEVRKGAAPMNPAGWLAN